MLLRHSLSGGTEETTRSTSGHGRLQLHIQDNKPSQRRMSADDPASHKNRSQYPGNKGRLGIASCGTGLSFEARAAG